MKARALLSLLVVAVAVAGLTGTAVAGLQFHAAYSTALPDAPVSFRIADLNNDSLPDAVTLGQYDAISILLGNGDGTLTNVPDFQLEGSFDAMDVGDMNSDGLPDLVVANDRQRIIFLGDGSGAFAAGPTWDGVYETSSLVVEDFNGDAIPDIAATHTSHFSVFLGNGDGSFDGPAWFKTESTQAFLIAGEFNGDAKPDLAVACAAEVFIFLNNGAGAFLRKYRIGLSQEPKSMVTGDLNNDGAVDLAITIYEGRLNIYLGAGDGTFSRSFDAEYEAALGVPAIADVNGDQRQDLMLPYYLTSGLTIYHDLEVVVLLGQGNGTFVESDIFASGKNAGAMIDDMNGDSLPDLLLAYRDGNGIAIMLGDHDDVFIAAPAIEVGDNPRVVLLDDFDGDGFSDLATMNPGYAAVLQGHGDGAFAAAVAYDTDVSGYYNNIMVKGDLNDDGAIDLVLASDLNEAISILPGLGDGSFGEKIDYPLAEGYSPCSMDIGDLNGDSFNDLVVLDYWNVTVTVLLGDGHFSFTPAATPPVELTQLGVLALGDLNGDAILDLVGGGPEQSLAISLGKGDGAFNPATSLDVGISPDFIVIGDLNNDATPDLVLSNRSGKISTLIGNGDGTFLPATICETGRERLCSLSIGDFDVDGAPDLAATHLNGDSVSILLGDGFGSFTPTAHYAVSSYPYRAAVGDLNGDGVPDLAVGNGTADTVSILINESCACRIQGLCYADGEENLENECRVCNPEVSVNDWSNAFDGAACANDGLFCTGAETCRAGQCVGSGDPCADDETCDETEDACLPVGDDDAAPDDDDNEIDDDDALPGGVDDDDADLPGLGGNEDDNREGQCGC